MRSPKASAACSKRSAKFKAMGTKVERVTVLGKPADEGELPVTASAVHDTGDVPGDAPRQGQPDALTERRGHVLIVTMNRPEARNALSGPMMAPMRSAWDQVDSDPGIRVCVLTGAGGAFCAGADLEAMTVSHPGASLRDLDLSVIESLLKGGG
jgi:Enoyl-CoA hydratase/isomerase